MSDRVFIVSALHRELFLEVLGGSTAPGAKLIVWRRVNHPNQIFSFTASAIISANSGLALDATPEANSPLFQAAPSDSSSQRWAYDPEDQTIRQISSDLAFDIRGSNFVAGTEVILAPRTRSHSQQWRIFPVSNIAPIPAPSPVYRIHLATDLHRAVAIEGLSRSPQARAVISSEGGFLNQFWTIEGKRIKSLSSGLVLDSMSDRSIVQNPANDTPTQEWEIDCDGFIRQPCTGLAIEATPSDGLILARPNGEICQEFRFSNANGGLDLTGMEYYYIQAESNGELVLGVKSPQSKEIVLTRKVRSWDQLWLVENGRLIRSVATNGLLTVNGERQPGSTLMFGPKRAIHISVWRLGANGRIHVHKSELVLGVRDKAMVAGGVPVLKISEDTIDERWVLVRVA
jgi:hypothetical protein